MSHKGDAARRKSRRNSQRIEDTVMPTFLKNYLQSLPDSDKMDLFKWLTQDSNDVARVIEILDVIDPSDNPLEKEN